MTRALVGINRVRSFLKELDSKWPYWAFSFNQVDHVDESIKLYLCCPCGSYSPGGRAVEIEAKMLGEVLV